MAAGARLRLQARAKINLFLDVLDKRSDGFHDIRSLLVPISLCDEVTVEKTTGEIETISDSAGLPSSAQNLATAAARLLKRRTGYAGGARIRLDKHVPVGGGLGGGSSDAAAVLRGLNKLWDVGLSRAELVELGSELGADVPALVQGGAVRAEGRGERVESVPVVAGTEADVWWLVLINPGFGVSTGEVYSRYKPPLTSPAVPLSIAVSAWSDGAIDFAAQSLFNALQETVLRKYPLIEIIVQELRSAGALGALLSGTGATVFALARDRDHAVRLERSVRQRVECPLWSRVDCVLRGQADEFAPL